MKQCTCYALRAVDCTCKPAKYGELYTSPTAKQEQGEPVAYRYKMLVEDDHWVWNYCTYPDNKDDPRCEPLYTTPQQRPSRSDIKPLTEWQPIETAPTKGRELILLLTPSKWPQVAYTNTWWTSGFSVENKPTHWMPIPPIEAAHGIKE